MTRKPLVSVARVTFGSFVESAGAASAVAERAVNAMPVKRDAERIRSAFIFQGVKVGDSNDLSTNEFAVMNRI